MRPVRRVARLVARPAVPPAEMTAAALARASSLVERLIRLKLAARASILPKSGGCHPTAVRAENMLAA